ncbi:arylsulfatase A-like enzyme [Kordia periserrulae]|uniref:Arylsulfatase A-like enzyme n=1 Tax=Kordia periserrulae TaxID=701523 RepID=A0A2T6C1Y4_9FLAO|nr:sulfatase [Kordia periserrulae]PTX62336.1 arylsulfatase A-like enzyme [Kordia periserrulae]
MKAITNISILFLVVLFLSCKTKAVETKNTAITEKPNILIIHVDDLGYHDLSMNGSQIYQTPNIDALGKESVVFTHAYANYPRCVPSRFAMMTGNYPIQNGSVPDDGFKMGNISDNKNFIKTIKNAGYQTAYFGKWHLGDKNSLQQFGFEYSFASGHAGSPISFLYPFNEKKGKGKTKKTPIPDVDEVSKEGDYLTDVMTNQVIDYIEKADKSKPFLAMFSLYAVHQPLEAKKEDIQRNRKEIHAFDYGNQPEYIREGTGRTKMRQDHPTYAAMVENMDENIGKLLNALKDLNIEDNTIVIFSSDHGGLSNDGTKKRQLATSNFPLRAGKGWLYEGGIKIPFFIKWNKLQSKTNSKSIITLMDVFPTLLDITTNTSLETDGKSFLPVLQNKEVWNDRTVFWHSEKARPVNTGDTKSSAIRKGNYKLIHWFKENRVELYDIQNDPYETTDLSQEKPNITKQLLDELHAWKSTF